MEILVGLPEQGIEDFVGEAQCAFMEKNERLKPTAKRQHYSCQNYPLPCETFTFAHR